MLPECGLNLLNLSALIRRDLSSSLRLIAGKWAAALKLDRKIISISPAAAAAAPHIKVTRFTSQLVPSRTPQLLSQSPVSVWKVRPRVGFPPADSGAAAVLARLPAAAAEGGTRTDPSRESAGVSGACAAPCTLSASVWSPHLPWNRPRWDR